MIELLDIQTALLNECGLAQAHTLVIAVSGGPDSLALLHRLVQLAPQYGWRLHVAHLDHGLRGRQSADEARFVAVTAALWGLSATVELRDVGALAQQAGLGLPAAARAARYTFLADVALAQHADAVVMAHQANDQAETVLLHLIRGAGSSGLGGMRPRVEWPDWRSVAAHTELHGPALVRPLLEIGRAEIEEYCHVHNLNPRRDPTNDSVEYRRGRIRHELLPILESFNPKIVAALGRTARFAAQEADLLAQTLASHWTRLVRHTDDDLLIRRATWHKLHPAVQRLALRRSVAALSPSTTDLSAAQIDHLYAALESPMPSCQLPFGLWLHHVSDGWLLTHTPTLTPPTAYPQLITSPLLLPIGAATHLPETSWYIHVQTLAERPSALSRWQVLLDAASIVGQLRLCQRQPGDRLRPLGGRGSRRVQDIMVDRKLPREARAHWPLLADDAGLLWIPTLVADQRTHPTQDTQTYVLVTLEDTATDASRY